jgi:hypothetical protein
MQSSADEKAQISEVTGAVTDAPGLGSSAS